MPFAAFLPAPIARITVAAPVTASPPAYTPSFVVFPVSSAMIHFLLSVSKPIVVEEITMPYTFETAGDYEVSVAVSSEAGCSTTFVETITIADKLSGPKVSYRGEEIREAEGDVVDMSYRPAGAWMAPAEVVIEPDGSTPLIINSVEIVGDYFDFDGLILENFIEIVNETVVDKAVNPAFQVHFALLYRQSFHKQAIAPDK